MRVGAQTISRWERSEQLNLLPIFHVVFEAIVWLSNRRDASDTGATLRAYVVQNMPGHALVRVLDMYFSTEKWPEL